MIFISCWRNKAANPHLQPIDHGYDRRYPHKLQHRETVAHNDVKPDNIFLKTTPTESTSPPEIVLGDFGLATIGATSRGCGTPE